MKFLFRGDCGLPIMLCPAAPAFRAHIRRGKSYEEAFSFCNSLVNIAWGNGNEEDVSAFVYQNTEFNTYDNPYVSTTSSLQTALNYSCKFNIPNRFPYITIIKPLNKLRYDDFLDFYKGGKSANNKECGMIGILFEDEIIAKVPIHNIPPKLITRIKIGEEPIEELIESYNQFAIDQVNELEYHHCPICSAMLSPYNTEALGTVSQDNIIEEFNEKIIISATPDAWISNGVSRKISDPYTGLRSWVGKLVSNGSLVICESCKSILCSPSHLKRNLACLSIKKIEKNEITLIINNNESTEIDEIWLGFIIKYNNQQRNIIRKIDRHTGLYSLSILNDEQHLSNPVLKPFKSITCKIVYEKNEKEAEKWIIEEVKIFKCHFESGKEWLPIDSLDRLWEFV